MVDKPLLQAARGVQPEVTPVWFMRQAGRSLPEYRELRQGVPMLEACRTPDLVSEITLQPVRRHGVDAAIFFSDIVVPLQAAGVDVRIEPGVGPVLAKPIRHKEDVARISAVDTADFADISASIRKIRQELDTHHPQVALIGFAGAPFTLASYAIEGGPSKNLERTKAMMVGEPQLFSQILSRMAELSAVFLETQIRAGAEAFQVFDSWAGTLAPADYETSVIPHTREVFQRVQSRISADTYVPAFHFGVTTGELLERMNLPEVDVLGVDFRVSLAEAARRLPKEVTLQGNLDPAFVNAPWEQLEPRVRAGWEHGRHIFNLGHGVLPSTDPEALGRITRYVHSLKRTG